MNRNILIAGVVILLIIVVSVTLFWPTKSTLPPKRSVVDIPKIGDIKNLQKWPYSETVKTEEFITGPDNEKSPLPVAFVHVSNVEFDEDKKEYYVSDEFTFDASRSYNPISDKTEVAWYFNDHFLTDDLTFKLKLDKKKNYVIRFIIADSSNEEYPVGSSAYFNIPYADASDDWSPLDTDKKYDE